MAAVGKTTIICPGCSEPIELTLRLDANAKAGPGELVVAIDRRAIERHLAQAHPETQDA
jgi:hypothetical protein